MGPMRCPKCGAELPQEMISASSQGAGNRSKPTTSGAHLGKMLPIRRYANLAGAVLFFIAFVVVAAWLLLRFIT